MGRGGRWYEEKGGVEGSSRWLGSDDEGDRDDEEGKSRQQKRKKRKLKGEKVSTIVNE